MLVSIAREGLRRHAVSRVIVLAAALVVGHVARSRASDGAEGAKLTRAVALAWHMHDA